MELYDITKVCNMLGTTSRALRFYEAEGLIKSTVASPSKRRAYTEIQLAGIKKVLALRALGLPVKRIKELLADKCSLEDAIRAHRVDIIRLITEKSRQINLLEEVLHDIENGNAEAVPKNNVECSEKQPEISEACTDAILSGDYVFVTGFFSEDMKTLLPEAALARSVEIATKPLGSFIEKLPVRRDFAMPNIVIQPLRYEKCIFRLKYVFHGDVIYGFWTDYE